MFFYNSVEHTAPCCNEPGFPFTSEKSNTESSTLNSFLLYDIFFLVDSCICTPCTPNIRLVSLFLCSPFSIRMSSYWLDGQKLQIALLHRGEKWLHAVLCTNLTIQGYDTKLHGGSFRAQHKQCPLTLLRLLKVMCYQPEVFGQIDLQLIMY